MSFLFGRRGEERSMSWWGTDSTPPGVRVDEERSLRLSPVFAAYRFLVDYISTLPVDAYRLDGKKRTDAPTPQLLVRQDEPGGPGLVSWLGQAVFGLACGNAVGWINSTDGFGYPADVSWLHWSQWSYDEQAKQWYAFGNPVLETQLVHIPWIVPPGRKLGLSPIEHMAQVIIAGLNAQEYADLKRGGGLPPVTLKNTARTLDPEQAAEVKRRASASFAKGEPFVTGQDWDLAAVTVPPNQAQFVDTLKMSANQVAAAFGIEPTELGGTPGGSLTYNTEELRELRRAADCNPYMTRLEHGLSRLMPARQVLKFNADAKVRADIKTRTEVVGAQIADGRMSVNEARELEDRQPIPGGDFHNVPHPKTLPAPLPSNGTNAPAPTADPTKEGAPL